MFRLVSTEPSSGSDLKGIVYNWQCFVEYEIYLYITLHQTQRRCLTWKSSGQ